MNHNKLTDEVVENEIEEMQIKGTDEIEELGLPTRKGGRPRKSKTVKTNLDLSPDVLKDLDSIAEYMGSSRQAVIKGFVLNGVNDFFKSRSEKEAS